LSTGTDANVLAGSKIFVNGIDSGKTVANGSATAPVTTSVSAASTGTALTVNATGALVAAGSEIFKNGFDTGLTASAANSGATSITASGSLTVSVGDVISTGAAVAKGGTAVTASASLTTNAGDVITFQSATAISSSSSSLDFMAAVQTNTTNRATLGTYQNQLNYIVDNLQTLSNNLADAKSRIVDTNYAAETANLTRGQILQQAATSMLAQANQMPNVILTLLK
jgi:flagellin